VKLPSAPRLIVLGVAALTAFGATPAAAWPDALVKALGRDARRLVPRSLAALLAEREPQVLEEARRFPVVLSQRLAVELPGGELSAETLAALETHAGRAVDLLRERRVSEGVVALGGLLRVPADLSDPVLAAGPEGYPAGVVNEYYAFILASLDKIPVVLDDPPALKLERRQLSGYWQGLLGRSRGQASVIRMELFRNGRLVDHRTLDYRSPVFGVASLAYSRAVTAIAATWTVLWREARGDLTRVPGTRTVVPVPDPASDRSTPTPPPEAE
jgi:ribosome modulation factor